MTPPRAEVSCGCFHGDARGVDLCLPPKGLFVFPPGFLLPPPGEKPELGGPDQGSALVLINQSVSVCVCETIGLIFVSPKYQSDSTVATERENERRFDTNK